ncbi:hypothetical protein D3C71_785150 [compost metagenome]
MFSRLQVQHELADGAFQTGQLALQHGEARTGHPGGGFKVQQAQSLAQVGMILGQTRRARLAPLQDFDIVVLVLAIRHISGGQILQARQQISQGFACQTFLRRRFVDSRLTNLPSLTLLVLCQGQEVTCLILVILPQPALILPQQRPDLFGRSVLSGQGFLTLGLSGAQIDVQRQDARDHIRGVLHSARRPAGDEGFGVVADGSDVVHGVNLRTFEKKPKAVTPQAESGKPLSADPAPLRHPGSGAAAIRDRQTRRPSDRQTSTRCCLGGPGSPLRGVRDDGEG